MILKPEVSVILSTYNRNRPGPECPSLVERAIRSVLDQTFFDFEFILINDASTDDTHSLCLKFAEADSRIIYIKHEKNSQLPARCYNEGIALSRGRFIAFMFDDDEWLPNALSDLYADFQLALKTVPTVGMVYGLTELFDISKNEVNDPAFGAPWDLHLLREHNYLANLAVMIRRDVFDLVGGYDEDPVMRRICDWDLWQRIGRVYHVHRVEKLVAKVYYNQTDSVGMIFDCDKAQVAQRQKQRTALPLQNRTMTLKEKWRYFLTYFKVHYPLKNHLVDYKNNGLHLIRVGIKSILTRFGCWNKVKSFYDRTKT